MYKYILYYFVGTNLYEYWHKHLIVDNLCLSNKNTMRMGTQYFSNKLISIHLKYAHKLSKLNFMMNAVFYFFFD